MKRPTVLIASTSHTMAVTLNLILQEKCIDLGINLELPTTTQNIFSSSDELFEYLEEKNPYELADTLVLLDLGNVRPVNAFSANAGTNSDGWHRVKYRAGVATELLLRFPQVYPVFMSLFFDFTDSHSKNDCCEDKSFKNCFNEEKIPENEELCILWLKIKKQVLVNHFVSVENYWDCVKNILDRFSMGYRNWFDPTGLRIFVKNYYLGHVFGYICKKDVWTWQNTSAARSVLLSRIEKVAVAVDEEREFALLNAYVAWKYGRRAWVVNTLSEFNEVKKDFKNNDKDLVIFRDIDLRFPDVDAKGVNKNQDSSYRQELKDIYSAAWEGFLSDKTTVRVISGAMYVADIRKSSCRSRFEKNECRLGQQEYLNENPIEYIGFSKPVGTLYDLQYVSDNANSSKRKSLLASLTPAFDIKGGNAGNHAAPYRNLAISESLIRQSRQCTSGAEVNLIGALLASEAYEILLGMSKTTALEALLLLHTREVCAEVEFPGISHNINIKERKRDIECSLNTLYEMKDGESERDNREKKRSNTVKRNFLTQFWAELLIKYRAGEQFEAAESANVQSFVNSNWTPWEWPTLWGMIDPIVLRMKYVVLEIATSLKWWVATTILFTVLMTAWYASLSGYSFDLAGWETFLKIWHQVVLGSLRLSPDDGLLKLSDFLEMGGFFRYLAIATHTIVSYILFGLFISMLYRKATRA